MRNVAGLPAPQAHDDMPGGARGPVLEEHCPLRLQAFRVCLCPPPPAPEGSRGQGLGGEPSPGVRLNWGEHACAQHTRDSFQRTEMPVTGGPRQEASETPLGVGGVVGSRASHLAGRGAGREWRGSGQHRGFGADMLKPGPGQGEGEGRAAGSRVPRGASAGWERAPARARCPGWGHRGGWVPGVRRSGRGRVAQSLPSAAASGGFWGGRGCRHPGRW